MTIEYLEIRDNTRHVIGILDTAESIIWHEVYYGVGDFEIYIQATQQNLILLSVGNFVTRLGNDSVGIIEKTHIEYNKEKGRMVIASGRFAKSILDRRLIYNLSGTQNKATVLSGLVEVAARKLVQNNAISCAFDSKRNIPILALGSLAGLTETIVDEEGHSTEKQVSYENLLEYTDELLQEYELGAKVVLNDSNYNLLYEVYKGVDRSTGNNAGNEPVIFSQDFDNLLESVYEYDSSTWKNTALIGGEGEGLERFYSLLTNNNLQGLVRRELWLDASSLSKKYKDDQDVERTYTDAQYKAMLNAEGKQTLADYKEIISFEGALDVTNGQFVINEDFRLGDIVTIQDNGINQYINARIVETTEHQDESGYAIEIVYQ